MEATNRCKLALPILMLALLAGCNDSEAKKEEEKFAIPVETQLAVQGNVSSFYSTTATLEAPIEAHVVTRISGLIESILVEEGDRVTKGQLLAVIDAKRQQYDLDRSEAEVLIIEQELERVKKMKNKEFVSADSIAKLEYNLQAAIARRDMAQLQVKESRILSPVDGVIAKRNVKAGNMAKEFEELFYVVNQDQLYGIVHLPEQQLASLRLGQHAELYTSNDKHRATNAEVLRISPVVDAQSGTFKVTLNVPNTQGLLKAGMFARVELKYDTHENVITVPYNAIINQDNKPTLYVIKESLAERREVQLGYREGSVVEVVSGLNPGENLVIRGQQNLKDQATVEVINPLNVASSKQ